MAWSQLSVIAWEFKFDPKYRWLSLTITKDRTPITSTRIPTFTKLWIFLPLHSACCISFLLNACSLLHPPCWTTPVCCFCFSIRQPRQPLEVTAEESQYFISKYSPQLWPEVIDRYKNVVVKEYLSQNITYTSEQMYKSIKKKVSSIV